MDHFDVRMIESEAIQASRGVIGGAVVDERQLELIGWMRRLRSEAIQGSM